MSRTTGKETAIDETIERLSESVMYGSDFPNLPYAYAEERIGILDRGLSTGTHRDPFACTAERSLGER